MESFVLMIYLASLLIFFIVGTLIIRHTVKYSYLSPRFKNVVLVFGLVAGVTILFSMFMMYQLLSYSGGSRSAAEPYSPSSSQINF